MKLFESILKYFYFAQTEIIFPRDSGQCKSVLQTGQPNLVMAREVQEQNQVYNAWRLVSYGKYAIEV